MWGVKSLLALLFAASALAADTNKTTNAISKPSTNAPTVNRRAALESRLKQIQGQIETLQAQDNARMKAQRLRTGRMGVAQNTATINALGKQANQLKAALIELDVAEGRLDQHKTPKEIQRRYNLN